MQTHWDWDLIAIIVTIIIWSVGVIFVMGRKLGTIQTDLTYVKNMIGNGTPGVFVRKSEVDLIVKGYDSDHQQIMNRLDRLEGRDENISGEKGV